MRTWLPAVLGLVGVLLGFVLKEYGDRRRHARHESVELRNQLKKFVSDVTLCHGSDNEVEKLKYIADQDMLAILLKVGVPSSTMLDIRWLWLLRIYAKQQCQQHQSPNPFEWKALMTQEERDEWSRTHQALSTASLTVMNLVDKHMWFLDRYLLSGRGLYGLMWRSRRAARQAHALCPDGPPRTRRRPRPHRQHTPPPPEKHEDQGPVQ